MSRLWRLAATALAFLALLAFAQEDDPYKEAEKQKRQLLEQSGVLPSDLFVEQGERLFKTKRGPKQASLGDRASSRGWWDGSPATSLIPGGWKTSTRAFAPA
jgi:hypothetical protein